MVSRIIPRPVKEKKNEDEKEEYGGEWDIRGDNGDATSGCAMNNSRIFDHPNRSVIHSEVRIISKATQRKMFYR